MSALGEKDFFMSRLHSLLGVIPIGFFLLEHLLVNSAARQGAAAYDRQIAFLQSLPYLPFLEIFVIILPVLFHALYGLWVVYVAGANTLRYAYLQNWQYLLQRVSAIITLVFVAYHVWAIRLSSLFYGSKVSFQSMAQALTDPLVMVVYVIGLVAAVFHFSNGLRAFLITWGITVGERSQRVASYWCALLFCILTVIGTDALTSFKY